nr:MAG: ORF1 [Torque teno midi virus]
MPFWWGRRKKWWTTTRFRRRRRRPYKRRARKTIFRRYNRRTHRRRKKRRRTKVRRKKQFLKLLQWQPDSIRKCKIKGTETIVLGTDGKQFRDYTSAMNEWIPPKVPGGGGFAIAQYTLEYLYEQHILHNNIWTHSNIDFDLVRYTGMKIKFYRHQFIDFVVHYRRQPPLTENILTPMNTHPLILLQQQHRIIIPSKLTKPNGKLHVKKKIKPPKQHLNKWYFIRDYSKVPLLLIQAAACDLNFVKYGKTADNNLTNLWSLNIDFYFNGAFGTHIPSTQDTVYSPISTKTYNDKWVTIKGQSQRTVLMCNNYLSSVNITTGWFTKTILQSKGTAEPPIDKPPTFLCRYNPMIDTGAGNKVWLKSTLNDHWTPPTTELYLLFENEPLWLCLYGWFDYINDLKPVYNIFEYYTLVIQSKYFQTAYSQAQNIIVPIDESFIAGKGPYNSTPTDKDSQKWIPVLKHQQQSINNIVKCGPYIPRPYAPYSNWELHCDYCFFFKWGGSMHPNNTVADPTTSTKYPVPDSIFQSVQITNPTKQIPQEMLHSWDYRRDFLTPKALKRMYEYLPTEQTIPTDADTPEPPSKKFRTAKKPECQEKETEVLQCLQQLFSENTSEEKETYSEEEKIQHLIKQQQQQQQQLKHNLLTLITHLKKNQLQMQLHTGIL